MCVRSIQLLSLALVFVLCTWGSAAPDDHLVLHLPFDEGSGTVTGDESPAGLQVTLGGSYQWTTGQFGQAVAFTGGQATVADSNPLNIPLITVMTWVNPTAIMAAVAPNHYTDIDSVYAKAGSDDDSVRLGLTGGDGIHFYVDTGSDFNLSVSDAGVQLGEWQHIAGTFDGTTSRIFLNGEQIGEMPVSGTIITNTNPATVAGGTFEGAVDEFKIFDVALTPDEIDQVISGGSRPFARKPSPGDGASVPETWVNLTWTAGDLAVSHDIYLGENFDDVNNGAGDTFRGNQTDTFIVAGFPGFPYPDGFVPGTTYYWRIDEVNDANAASPWKGAVWSFSVPSKIANAPVPVDGARFVEPETTLSWTAGFGAKFHTVYFGDSFDEVDGAAGGLPQVDVLFIPGALEFDKTYYWRVDEFIGTATNRGDVWSFTTLPLIPVAEDPDLAAWWNFDEGIGSTALDWSGNGNHVTLFGSEWVSPGVLGDAALRIGRYGAIENLSYAAADLTEVTVTAWVRTSSSGDQYIVSFDRNEYYRLEINGDGGGPGQIGWDVMTSSGQIDYGSITRVDDGRWHHITGVFASGTATIYIDGVPEPSATGGSTFGTGNTRFGYIGANSEATDFNVGRGSGSPVSGEVDDIRIYHRALTREEILLIMRGDPRLAWGPSPSDGATPDVDSATPLNWSAGDDASSHEVYFGTDEEAVENADTSDTTGIYRGRQNATTFTPAEGVEWGGGPYFWRVDENNNDGTVSKGRAWSLTVADFILVDDFESYTDDDAANQAIWQHWIDGFGVATNGVQAGYLVPPYAEQTIVNGGAQSMPLIYDNTAGVRNSEVVLSLTDPRDWTKHGVGILSLWYRGLPPSVGSFVEGLVGTFTMTGSGADIWDASDEFHFAYKTLTGPGTIVARVDSIENTHDWAKAGVMIRETLDADSKYAFAVVSAASGVAAQNRLDTGVNATGTTEAGISAPVWVRLERDVAGFFTVSHSTNGSSWVPVQNSLPNNIPMASNVYIGLAVTSHNAAATCEAKFSNVAVTGNVGLQWANEDIGIQANSAEPLYVSLSNANNTTAVVTNSDANAAVTDVWTEWRIDLSDFAAQGINLSNVDKIAVGLGATGDPAAAGGKGTMFIDDIVLRRPAPAPQP